MLPASRQRQCDCSVAGEVTDEVEVVVVEGRLLRAACNGDDTEYRVVGNQWHDDGRAFTHIGEPLDRILERIGDEWPTATCNAARGGAVHGDLATNHLRCVPARRRGHDEGFDVIP